MSLSKKSKIFLSILVVGIVAAVLVYQYSMQPPKQIEAKAVDFTGTSDELLVKIQVDANAWQDKVVVITGDVSNLNNEGCVLSSSIFCQFKKDTKISSSLTEGKTVTLKGRVIGYDDLLEEVKLDQCIIQ